MTPLTFDALRRIFEKFPRFIGGGLVGRAWFWNDGTYYTLNVEIGDLLVKFDEDLYGPAGIVPWSIDQDGRLVYTGESQPLRAFTSFTPIKEVRLSQ